MIVDGVVKRVVTQTKADAAYGELRRLVLEGEIAGGTVLNQEQLAASLGVSTTPLREALRRLESEGLVVTQAKGQVAVTVVDGSTLPALFVVREELDCLAASLAAEHATREDHAALREALGVPDSADRSHAAAWALNREFHLVLARASHNPVLCDEIARLWEQYDRHSRTFTEVVFFDLTAQREHGAIVDAIEQRRGRDAAVHMRAHYARGRATILGE